MYFTEIRFSIGDIFIILFSLILSWTTYPMIKELVRILKNTNILNPEYFSLNRSYLFSCFIRPIVRMDNLHRT